MKVLITGGAGYIGNELVLELTRDPQLEKVVVYDNLSRRNYNLFLDPRLNHKKLHFINADILDTSTLANQLDDIDVLYHLAGLVPSVPARENPHLYEHINLWGTAEMVSTLEDSKVKKLIYLSSASVYGFSDHYLDITTQPNPQSLYAASMLKGEKFVMQLAKKIDTYIFRCADVYGYSPSARFESAINKYMFEVNFMGRLRIRGNGDEVRSYIHVATLTKALKNLLFDPNQLESGIYNISDKNYSMAQIAMELKEIYPYMTLLNAPTHEPLLHRVVKKDIRVKHLMGMKCDSLKEELLSFKNQFSFNSYPTPLEA